MWEGLFHDGAPTRLLKSWSKYPKRSHRSSSQPKYWHLAAFSRKPLPCTSMLPQRLLVENPVAVGCIKDFSPKSSGSGCKRIQVCSTTFGLKLKYTTSAPATRLPCLQLPRKTQILHLWARARVWEALLLASCGLFCCSLSNVWTGYDTHTTDVRKEFERLVKAGDVPQYSFWHLQGTGNAEKSSSDWWISWGSLP